MLATFRIWTAGNCEAALGELVVRISFHRAHGTCLFRSLTSHKILLRNTRGLEVIIAEAVRGRKVV